MPEYESGDMADQDSANPKASSDPAFALHRPIHYLGSKLRFASDIARVLSELTPGGGAICDLFSGSGVVASAIGQHRPVIAVDIQEYARALASALLNPVPLDPRTRSKLTAGIAEDRLGVLLESAWAPLVELEHSAIERAREGDSDLLADLLEALPIVRVQTDDLSHLPRQLQPAFDAVVDGLSRAGLGCSLESLVSRHYGGLYFGLEQAVDIDVLCHRARRVKGAGADLVMSAVLATASAVVGTVGKQFAQPLRPRGRDGRVKPDLWKRVSKDRSVDVLSVFEENLRRLLARMPAVAPSLAVRSDFRDFLESWDGPLSAVYADPPYTRDHYSRYYHALETIALGDQPSLSRTNLNGGHSISRGVYRLDRHQSPFSICSEAPGAFEELFRLVRARQVPLVLSYSPQLDAGQSRPRVMSVDGLIAIAKQHFADVGRVDVEGVAHSKLTRTDMHLAAPATAEILLVCRP